MKISKEEAQKILDYITSIPSGDVPLGKALEIVQILLNLKEEKND